MKYELLSTGQGILIDRTPIMQDIRDTYEVSFLLPEQGAYTAVFNNEFIGEIKKPIKNDKVKVNELLGKEQYVSLTVCQLGNEGIIKSWECEPIRVTNFNGMTKTQWQISGGMTDKDYYARLNNLEKLYGETLNEIALQNIKLTEAVNLINQYADTLLKDYKDLIRRVKALEGIDLFSEEE